MDSGVNNGRFNMDCDNLLLDCTRNSLIQYPLLRVYGWNKLTLSIGANQEEQNNTRYPMVKRITGGQAVLHENPDNELTYSIILKYSCQIKKLYFEIGEVLLCFLKTYSLKGQFGYSTDSYSKKFDCFDSRTEADIVINDIKVIGSAQCRKKECVLQHGSIKLNIIRQLSGKDINFETAKTNLKKSFENKLKIKFIDYTLKVPAKDWSTIGEKAAS